MAFRNGVKEKLKKVKKAGLPPTLESTRLLDSVSKKKLKRTK